MKKCEPYPECKMGKLFSKNVNPAQSTGLTTNIVNSNNVSLENIMDSHQKQQAQLLDIEVKIEIGLLILIVALLVVVLIVVVKVCRSYKFTVYNRKNAQSVLEDVLADNRKKSQSVLKDVVAVN